MPGAAAARWTVSALRRHPAAWALASVLAFYVGTRLALLWRFPPFLDEANYAVWAKDVHDSLDDRFIALANGRGPMFSWLGAVVIWLGAAPLTAVRLISIGSGLGSMACVGVLGRRLGGVWTGVGAAALYAVVPYFVVHDSLGLFEPLLVALGLVALVLQIKLAEEPRLDLALLLGIVLGTGLLAKESARFPLVLLPASLLCFSWQRDLLGRRLLRWAAVSVVAVAVAGAMYSIMKLSPLYAQFGQAKSATEPIRSYGSALAHPLRWLNANWPGDRANFGGYVTWPLIVLAAIGIGLGLRARPRYALLLLIWLLVPLFAAALLVENTFARYTLQAVPPLVVFSAYGLFRAIGLARAAPVRRSALAAGVTGAVALLLVPALRFDGHVLADPNRADYPGTSDDEYATGWPAGNAWVAVAHELDRLVGSGTSSLTVYDQGSNAFALSVHAKLSGSAGNDARYVIENGKPVPSDHGPGELRLIWQYARPRNGVVLKLYERGVTVNGRFYSTPTDLRAGLGLSDKDFDAFVQAHPDVKAWYDGAVAAGV